MLGGVRPQAPGRPVGKIQGQPTSHWLEPVGRREVSEGLMSLMVAVSCDAERSRRGDEGRAENERAGKGGVRGFGRSDSGEGGGLIQETPGAGKTSTDTK